MTDRATTAEARRRAASLIMHTDCLNTPEYSFLHNIVHMKSHAYVTEAQVDWLHRISTRIMREEVRRQELNGEYLGKLRSIIGGDTCAECQRELPKDRKGVSNFCCVECLNKRVTK